MPVDDSPLVSIIIPTRNRPALLSRCVESLQQFGSLRGGVEIIVVDDGSSPRPDIARRDGSPPLRVLRLAGSGPAAARNCGARDARGALLAFLDDDCIPAADWLPELLEQYFANSGPALCGSHIANGRPRDLLSAAAALTVGLGQRYYNVVAEEASFLPAAGMLVAKRNFLALGGFDETLRAYEDCDFCARWRQAGGRIAATAAVLYHHDHQSPFAYLAKHFAYGRGARQYRQKHGGDPLANRHARPAALREIFALAGGAENAPRALLLCLILALRKLAHAAGYHREKTKTAAGRSSLPTAVPR